ncbi:meiosis-specific coiled-coil domain-containing protein MEIOC-like [Conger conger]|uniref:meiosis-specific coiled-coil domain-containing protein MEIOC-like n=1 Tax=Conger conger TaxID=82655 RepID=UPI002A5AC1B5|nr:meiosis-specific coiled-coil domain-containing protein MEIOC-like [Conger conger]
MAYQGSSYSHYKPQNVTLKESMDTQLLPSKVFSDGSGPTLDPALLYRSWSVFTDDVKPATTFPDGNLSRPQVNLTYSGNGPDVFGMVSRILEEPNPEHLGDWNSSSKLFPLWAADSDHIGQQENMVQFENGSSDIGSFYQDDFQKIEGDHLEDLYHGFQGLDLMDSWLLGGKDSGLASLDSRFTTGSCNQEALLKGPPFSDRDNFGLNKSESDPCMQDGHHEVLNGSLEKMCGEFGMYAFHNRSNSNNTRLQKELKVEQGSDKFSKCGSSFAYDPSSPLQREKWTHTSQQRQYPFRGNEDYNGHPPLQKTFSPSQSHYGIPHTKVNGRTWKADESLGPNQQNGYLSSRKLYDQCEINAVDPCDFTPATNFRNTDYLHPGKYGLVWSEGDAPGSSWKSCLQNGKSCSPGHSPQMSLSGLSNISCNGKLGNHLLTPGPKRSYHSQTSPVSPGGRQDRRAKPGEGHGSGAWLQGITLGNANLNTSASHSRLDSSVTKDHHTQHGYPCSWSGASAGEDPDKYLYNRTKHSPDGHDDVKGMRKNNCFPPSNACGGSSRHQYNSNNNYWHKEDQEKNCASDYNSTHFSPPFQLMTGDLKQNPSLAPLDLHGGAGGGGNSGGFPLPQSGFPFSDLMEMLQSEDLSHLSPFVTELLNGDVPPPYFGFPPLFNKYRPMRNRSGPANELHVQLELCYEQWRTLEKERKKTEANLARNFPGRRVSSSNNSPIPCLPANPSRVDRLIVDQLREQTRVVVLVGKMERLRSAPVHANITTTLERHLEAIRFTQQCRKDEIVNTANRQRQGAPRYSDDKDVLALAAAIKELATLTRKARTALWCALQMTLPKGVLGMAVRQVELERALLELCNPREGKAQGLGSRETQPPAGSSGDMKEARPRGGRVAKAELEIRAANDQRTE